MPATRTDRPEQIPVDWTQCLAFVMVHVAALCVLLTGATWSDIRLGLALYIVRMFFITAGYHRYFAHRSYRLGRPMQFLMALGGTLAAQKGPLWWAGLHRHHHRYADQPEDIHSPRRGFWWSHARWFLVDRYLDTPAATIRDFARFPELRALDRHWILPPFALGAAVFFAGGLRALVVGFFVSTVVLFHATFSINSVAHLWGRRRYATGDDSRNSLALALITGGEGWHNNHHHYPAAANNGFFWWEVDTTYYGIRVLSWLGLASGVRRPPPGVLTLGRLEPAGASPRTARAVRPAHVVMAAAAATLLLTRPARAQVPLQPLAQHVRAVASTLAYLGQPLTPEDVRGIDDAIAEADERTAVARLQEVLDAHVLVVVDINPESRVKVEPGAARAELVEGGTRVFLVKVRNQAGVTAPLEVESPNSGAVSTPAWTGSPEPKQTVTSRDVMDRWADVSLYRTEVNVYSKPPMGGRLSGLPLEYGVLQVYSRDRGKRSALLRFNVGQGSQDIGFRNEATILFDALPAYPVRLRIKDEQGRPATASFLIRDRLRRVYPSQSKRLAPDFPFQPQIYRMDEDTILLPAGAYTVTCDRGPEYDAQVQPLVVGGPAELSCRPTRWIDPSQYGWYSGDHHIHAAGCAHYESPEQGVGPKDMLAQVQGEALNVGSVLTWGPCYYHQKQFFSGQDHPLSTDRHLLHYDLEVSGFPSSHAGHLVLLGLKEQDYPGASRIEQWPTWDLPVLRWAKAQGAVTGFAHSGWGLAVSTSELPNDEMPGFDSIGANEYIVDVTHEGAVDFISAADTPPPWELNIWYHTLDVGFRTRISGETDFPCITQDRVGQGRSYGKVEGRLTYAGFVEAVRNGRTYVGDGRSHLMDFAVNGREAGTGESEIRLAAGDVAKVTVKVAALLDPSPNEVIRRLRYDQSPYWDVERARVGSSREVPVELIVNGRVAVRKTVTADGAVRNVSFEVPLRRSSWLAVRILPSSHTNPIFAIVDGQPIRASRRSAEWCLAAVNQCWTQKAPKIAPAELEEARAAYDHARAVYRRLISESPAP